MVVFFFFFKCLNHVVCLPPKEEDIADSNAVELGIKEKFRRLTSAKLSHVANDLV